MEGMFLVCGYYNHGAEEINVYFDEQHECVTIINYDRESIHMIKELKNMNFDMFKFIADDFDSFDYIDSENFVICKDDADYIRECTEDGEEMIREIVEDFEIKIQE